MELWEIGEKNHSKFHKEDAVAEWQVGQKRQSDKPDKGCGRRLAYNDISNSERMSQVIAHYYLLSQII